MPLIPKILWAERKQHLLITIDVQDATDTKFDVQPTYFSFEGKCKDQKGEVQEFATKVELNGEIDVEESTHRVLPRNVEMKLKKKEEGYWNKLQKGAKDKQIEVDWAKFVDEDEEQNADLGGFGGDAGFGGMPGMGGMGGMPGMGGMGGMPGLGGMGGMPGMGGMGGMDMAQLQAMMGGMGGEGGMPDFGAMGMGEDDEGEDDGDDDGPPPLEGEGDAEKTD